MIMWNFLKKSRFIAYFKKKNKIVINGMLRPNNQRNYFSQSPFFYPTFPYNRFLLYDLSYASDTLSTIHIALKREIFRNGLELVEAKKTKEEHSTSEALTTPKGKTEKEILQFLENCNEAGQTLMDVSMEIEDDFNIMDNGFMVFLFEYIFDNGKIKSRELKEILRADPRNMGPVLNKYDRPAHNDNDDSLYFCPQHRDSIIENKNICPRCGTECWLAFYFKESEGKKVFYAKWEVVFKQKYRPSLRGGFPPVISCWQKTRTLLFMDKYIMEMYDGQRPPKHGLFFKTSNADSLYKALDEAKQRIQDDPHWPLMLAIPDATSGKEFVQFIDFMRSLDELQHVEMRNEFRRVIGGIYGVEPLFQGDQSQGGGLNNEGLQVTVTNRSSEFGQSIYNNYYYPKVMESLGAEGWSLKLRPSEEQDEMAKLDRLQRTLQNGQLALQLGLEAEFDDDTQEVRIQSGKLVKTEESLTFPRNLLPSQPSGTPSLKARTPFTRLSDTIKEEINKFLKKFKRKPSEADLKRGIKDINRRLARELNLSSKGLFKKLYSDEMEKVGRELGVNIIMGKIDENAIEVLNNQKVLAEAYEGIASKLTEKINEIIEDAYKDPKGLTVQQMTDKIKELTETSDFHAETIARTETGKISSAARKNSYAKEEGFENFKFKWIGPDDHRTTDTSKRIKARTSKGVTLDNLIKIVTEESAKDFPEWTVYKDFPVSHYNSRHTFIKT